MRISEFIDSTNAAKSAEEVFHLYEKAVAYYGFDRIMYSALTRHPAHDSISTPSIMRNYPDDWINHYVEKGYIQTDPVRKYGIATRGPFTWEGMEEKLQLSPAQKDVMNGGREAGLHNGIGHAKVSTALLIPVGGELAVDLRVLLEAAVVDRVIPEWLGVGH